MAKLPRDPQRRTEIEWNGKVIWRGPAWWPELAASFTPDVQRRILDKTGKLLRVPPNMQPRFWQNVEQACRLFAFEAQLDHAQRQSALKIRTARADAKRSMASNAATFGPDPADVQISAYVATCKYVEFLDRQYPRRNAKPKKDLGEQQKSRAAKPKHMAGRNLIRDIGGMYAAAFESDPSTAPDGPFARFVLAGLAETQGLPETVSGNWVQKYVREYKAASRDGSNLWALSRDLAWDDPA